MNKHLRKERSYMKKIYLAFLIVVGSFSQLGNAQNVSSGGGKLAGGSNELLSGKSKSNEPGCVVLAVRGNKINSEGRFADPASDMTKGVETPSQLDPVTMEMAGVAVMQMDEQAKVALQDSTSALIKANAAQDHEIMTAILGEPTPNDVLEILRPGLAAERESFARDLLKTLLRYDVTLDPARRGSPE
jgi:hypothetical protein